MKISLFEIEAHERAAFDRLRSAHTLRICAEPLGAGNVAAHADAEILSPFIYSDLHAGLLAQLPALKLIATRSTGYDHIDTAYCARHGIAVANVPVYGDSTVAEHVFALLLSLSHRIPEAVAAARSGNFSPRGLEGFDLDGKTLGVVGTGRIGQHVIRIARGFGMPVLASDARPDDGLAQRLGFRYVALDVLLAESDVVTLHVPATPATHHLLSAAQFARMKPGAVLINTARGSIVEPGALIEALVSGRLAGAGLDVLPDEPAIREEAQLVSSIFADRSSVDLRGLVADHLLLRLPNVVVTPHSGFNTREALARIVDTTLDNIEAFIAGRSLNRVMPSRTS